MMGNPRLALIERDLAESLFPRYELLQLLGAGAMGAVFQAREPALERLVAVKVLGPEVVEDPRAAVWFQQEGRATAALSHPNAVRVYTVGVTEEHSLPYMVMQHVDGVSLKDRIQEAGRVEEREVRRIVGEVAAALAAAHARGLVHRDVKPANILLEAESGRAYLTDFGLTVGVAAEAGEADPTGGSGGQSQGPGAGAGTPKFMSPEQAACESIDTPSDVYSLGLVAYNLLSGRLPFAEPTAIAWRAAHMHDEPESIRVHRPDLSPELAHLLERCLSKKPEERPTAAQVSDLLLPGLLNEIVWPPPALQSLRGSGRRLAQWITVMGAVATVLIMLLAAPPRATRPDLDWWSAYSEEEAAVGSTLGILSELEADPSAGTTLRVWRLVLIVGGALLVVGLPVAAFYSWLIGRRHLRSRRAGWNWDTLADVAADPDGRSGLLLTGSRELATLGPAERERARWARRRQVGLALAANAWILLVPGVYSLLLASGLLSGLPAGPILPPAVLWFTLGPSLLALLGVGWARRTERRALGELPLRHPYAPALLGPAEAPDPRATADWYAGLPEPRTSAPSDTRRRHGEVGLAGVIILGVVVGGGGLGALIGASLVAADVGERVGPSTAEAARILGLAEQAFGLDRVLPGWRAALVSGGEVSSASVSGATAPLAAQTELRGLLDPTVPGAPSPYPPELAGAMEAMGARVDSLVERASGLSPATLAMADQVARHPRTTAFRRLARGDDLDLIAAVAGGSVSAYSSLSALPDPAYGRLREAAVANALGSVGALARGDTLIAEMRLIENAAFAYGLAQDPRLFVTRYAVGLLQSLAILPLSRLEAVRGDTARAAQLRESIDRLRELAFHPVWVTGLSGFASDPGRLGYWEAVVSDSSLPGGLRVAGLEGAWRGFCLNPREILGGLSPSRAATARRVAASIDVPNGSEVGALVERGWRLEVGDSGPWLLTAIRYCAE